MRKRLRKFFLFLLATLFIFEAWLWEACGTIVSAVIRYIPFDRLKRYIADRIEHLSPYATLAVFVIPAAILLPFKLIAVWCFAEGYWLAGIGAVVFLKLAGLGVTSFLFGACKPKLMQLRAIRWLYEHCIYWRDRAYRLVAPYIKAVRRAMRRIRSYFPHSKLLEKIRRYMHNSRKTM